jgi:hypothetical protein
MLPDNEFHAADFGGAYDLFLFGFRSKEDEFLDAIVVIC